ncbi:MAG: hypothetical protein K2X93_11470, partial [Candidatus Obscuribacterales bacterium]|nr:hypothetical protein [Candidatus Obscuribacterales bacterium]
SKVAVAPGALENERGELLVKIMDAQKQGINIVAYLTACKDIEGLVKAGSSTEVIRTRIDSIERSLNDQLSRKEVLKNKGPTPMDKRHPKILAPGQVVPPEWRWQPHY